MMRTYVAFFCFAALALAQDRTSSVAGVVTDITGAVVHGVVIKAIDPGTGSVHSAVTQPDGSFRLVKLPLGVYSVTAEQEGFKSGRREAVPVELDRTTVVDFRLEVGQRTETVLVTGESRQIETTSSALTHLVDARTIQQLPLNGRDYVQLATLQAGTPVARAQSHNVNQGYGVQISISGSRPFQNSFRLDGLDVTYNGSSPGSVNGLTLGVDAVGEFSLLSSTFGAQFGQAAGGIVNAATRSGSNQFHGTGFYFHRNDNLDARNFFDVERPEFRRHQFGGSLGAPIIRNKTFFFLNYEGLREARGNTAIDTTLSAAARQGNLTTGSVVVDPKIAQVLPFYPLPNGQVLGDTGLFVYANNTISDQNFVTSRIDQNLGDADKLFGRYSSDTGKRQNETSFQAGLGANWTRNQSAVLEETHIFSPGLVNTARFGFTRFRVVENQTVTQNPAADNPALEFVPGAGVLGNILVTGLTDFPGGTGSVSSDVNLNRSYQASNDLVYSRGRHLVNLGVRVERDFLDTDSQTRQNGDFRFPSITRFLRNMPDRFRAQFPGSDTVRQFGQWISGAYVQDTWHIAPRLTLDAGLRWETASVPEETNGKVGNLVNITDTTVTAGNPLFHKKSLSFSPRLGLAWDVFGTGSTVIRTGYGLYQDFIRPHYIVFLAIRNPPYFSRGETRSLSTGDFPNGGYARLLAAPTLDQTVYRIDRDINQPYVQQWNFNIEQRLTLNNSVRIAYVGSHGLNLSSLGSDANLAVPETLSDGRLFFPANGQAINPGFGQVWNRTFQAHSFYHALQTSFQRRLTRRLQAQLSYSYSKSIDDSSNYFSGTEADNIGFLPITGSPKFNRALSGQDVRHYFTASGIWQLPTLRSAWDAVLGGWQLGTIATLASGSPTSVLLAYDAARTRNHATDTSIAQRPDLILGVGNLVTGDPQQWVNPSAFSRPVPGFLGNVGRNTITGPDLINMDFSMIKRIPVRRLGEAASLDLRFEFFNLFNRTNFGLPTIARMGLFTATATREDFARITTAGPSREIQLGMKLQF